MGIEKDYIVRQMMLMFEALQKILRLRKENKNKEALFEIQNIYAMLEIDENIENMDIEDFIAFLETDKNLTRDQIEMVGYVLKEHGEIENDAFKKVNFFSKSFFILNKVDRESITFSMDRKIKLEEINKYLITYSS
jgi:hypothetical protein